MFSTLADTFSAYSHRNKHCQIKPYAAVTFKSLFIGFTLLLWSVRHLTESLKYLSVSKHFLLGIAVTSVVSMSNI